MVRGPYGSPTTFGLKNPRVLEHLLDLADREQRGDVAVRPRTGLQHRHRALVCRRSSCARAGRRPSGAARRSGRRLDARRTGGRQACRTVRRRPPGGRPRPSRSSTRRRRRGTCRCGASAAAFSTPASADAVVTSRDLDDVRAVALDVGRAFRRAGFVAVGVVGAAEADGRGSSGGARPRDDDRRAHQEHRQHADDAGRDDDPRLPALAPDLRSGQAGRVLGSGSCAGGGRVAGLIGHDGAAPREPGPDAPFCRTRCRSGHGGRRSSSAGHLASGGDHDRTRRRRRRRDFCVVPRRLCAGPRPGRRPAVLGPGEAGRHAPRRIRGQGRAARPRRRRRGGRRRNGGAAVARQHRLRLRRRVHAAGAPPSRARRGGRRGDRGDRPRRRPLDPVRRGRLGAGRRGSGVAGVRRGGRVQPRPHGRHAGAPAAGHAPIAGGRGRLHDPLLARRRARIDGCRATSTSGS